MSTERARSICTQGFALSTNVVQREHQELRPPFTSRILDDHRLEFGYPRRLA